jgi:hypothetical protein
MVAPIFRRDDLRMTDGNPSVSEIKSQGSGKMVRVNFCPSCGTKLYLTLQPRLLRAHRQ